MSDTKNIDIDTPSLELLLSQSHSGDRYIYVGPDDKGADLNYGRTGVLAERCSPKYPFVHFIPDGCFWGVEVAKADLYRYKETPTRYAPKISKKAA